MFSVSHWIVLLPHASCMQKWVCLQPVEGGGVSYLDTRTTCPNADTEVYIECVCWDILNEIFQHQDTETSSAVNHSIYKKAFLLLPVENQFVPYCWCLTPNFVCWLPLPSKQFKVQRRPHIVGRCINTTNIRWYVCASFTVGQYLIFIGHPWSLHFPDLYFLLH